MSDSSRPRRKCRKTKPNPVMYVGYVEDDETPEMIMKKFATMEQCLSKSHEQNLVEYDNENKTKTENQQNINEQRLTKIFQETSNFSVSSVLKNNEVLWEQPILDEDGFIVAYEKQNLHDTFYDENGDTDQNDSEFEYLLAESEDLEKSEDEDDSLQHVKRKISTRTSYSKQNSCRLAVGALARPFRSRETLSRTYVKRKRLTKVNNISKLPSYPFPLTSYTPMIRNQFIDEQHKPKNGIYIEKGNLCSELKLCNLPHNEYAGILMDPPFKTEYGQSWGDLTIQQFSQLPIHDLTDTAMLFIWTPSELIWEVTLVCEKNWNFSLVEHAIWVKKTINDDFYSEKSKYINISKVNLLLFQNKSVKCSLRHQRTPDVHMAKMSCHPVTKKELKPLEYTYKLIETLLADAKNNSFLYLFCFKLLSYIYTIQMGP